MYKDILESIENLKIKEEYKTILLENCLENIFSWNPYKIKKCEYYRRYIDWLKLKKIANNGSNIQNNNIKNEMLSDFYKNALDEQVFNGKISVLVDNFRDDDIKILLAMKTLNSQVWHNRISAFWTTLISLLSLIVAIIAILTKTVSGN